MSLGVDELDSGAGPLGRARRPGDGGRRLSDLDQGLRPALLALVEPEERGDPMSPLRWTTKSTRKLAGRAAAKHSPIGPTGRRTGAVTVGAQIVQLCATAAVKGPCSSATLSQLGGRGHSSDSPGPAQFRGLPGEGPIWAS